MKTINRISNFIIFNTKTVTKNTNVTSEKIDLRSIAANGVFSLQYLITGDGVVKFEYLLSNEDLATTMIEPSTATDIGSSLSKTTGLGGDGKDILPFEPEIARWLQIKCTETGTASTAVVTAWLAIQ